MDAAKICETAPALRMLYMRAAKSKTAVAVYFENNEAAGKTKPTTVRAEDDLAAAFAVEGGVPEVVNIEGTGLFALAKTKAEADAIIKAYPASPEKVKPTSDCGRMSGKIAIVTGSAQGFGKGIAQAMAKNGAYIVVADLNPDGAKACADELCKAYGAGTAISVAVNVADEESVAKMVQAAIINYGGLDILVSNAGIAIAGSLAEMTRDKFELVTSVNYTGYFLCAKYACVPMKLQHKYAPEYLMDIIEINSKSGLEGSNKNFAYAGSKFGGLGLTQSFALELVEYGIKVNAICPGNFLDGPLWSDPEKGLFKQYFEAGKVAGAKTIADVRKFYESKVPMNRGCIPDDVACAIFYVVEQKYETGQAIPVTGGQIMLK